jgi:peptidyl-tRNA hydrolase, PTH1 family
MKVIACLGNPGSEYASTRHNVGWWLADRIAETWNLGRFKRSGPVAVAEGRIEGVRTRVLKPLSYMNRSGSALVAHLRSAEIDITTDLLVVVDDVALEPGRARLRASGSAGGHNGLKSVEASLRTQEYPRLRIGVGAKPAGADLADWVLSPLPREDRQTILSILPSLVDCVAAWVARGTEAAMNDCNAVGAIPS